MTWHIKKLMARTGIRLLKATGWYSGYWNHWRGELFEHAQRRGLHILPVHYYTPVPDTRELPEDLWSDRPDPFGLSLRTDTALELLARLAEDYRQEYDSLPFDGRGDPRGFDLANPAYSCGDAEVLYSMIRHLKPRRIIEVGSGRTTLLISQAIGRNAEDGPGARCEFLAIEPYPPDYLQPPPSGVTRMMQAGVQSVPLEEFTKLVDKDILFIDSSHVAAVGSDVTYLFLEVLPRLSPGVVVHVHDVFLPFEYPRAWFHESRFFWNEQYLLHALLLFNNAFEVMMPTYAIFRRHPDAFKRLITSCARHEARPGSFWMRKTGASE